MTVKVSSAAVSRGRPAPAAKSHGMVATLSEIAWPSVYETVLALGLGLVIFFRPWHDGMTFPERNAAFTWAVGVITVIWAVRPLLGSDGIRFRTPMILFVAFLAVAAVTARWSTQADATYAAFVNWVTYFLVFAVAANGLRSRSAIAIVLTFFVVTSIAETVWAIFHAWYVMPMQRAMIMRDPTLLPLYFGQDAMTAEVRSRLESRRTTGSLLFANALACWTLTGIAVGLGCAMNAYRRIRLTQTTVSEPADPAERRQSIAVLVGIATAFVAFLAITMYYSLYFTFAYRGDTWQNHLVRWGLYCVATPVAFGAAAGIITHRHGLRLFALQTQIGVCAGFLLIQTLGLALTYSRGAMLALTTALLLGAFLLWKASGPARSMAASAAMTAISAVVILASASLAAAAQPSSASPEAPPAVTDPLSLEGYNPSLDAMLSPATALLRFSYWGSGIRMAFATPLAGVGLGNFGTMYPRYQYLGAGPTKQAHNDYLQAFCEVGLFGGAVFLAFWVFFALWGARRILTTRDAASRWLLAALYMAVMGIALHSIVDFNFQNPSLATLAYLFAGLYFSLAAKSDQRTEGRAASRGIAAALIIFAIGIGYMASRGQSVYAAVGAELERRIRLESAGKLFDPSRIPQRLQDGRYVIPDGELATLIPDRTKREQLGRLYTPAGPGTDRYRPVSPQEPIPPNAALFLENPSAARVLGVEYALHWINATIEADRRYPLDPGVSANLVQWYDLLYEYRSDAEERLRWADACLEWAEACVARSPHRVEYRDLLGNMLWRRGGLENGAKQIEYYDGGMKEFRKCPALYPTRVEVWVDFGNRCIEYGKRRLEAGDDTGGRALIDEGNRALEHAERLNSELERIARETSPDP
jgi:O-antigen ligase